MFFAGLPSQEDVIAIMRKHLDLSDSLYDRRAQSVRGWLEWIFHLCRDVREVQK